jgi:hypothetical protein
MAHSLATSLYNLQNLYVLSSLVCTNASHTLGCHLLKALHFVPLNNVGPISFLLLINIYLGSCKKMREKTEAIET